MRGLLANERTNWFIYFPCILGGLMHRLAKLSAYECRILISSPNDIWQTGKYFQIREEKNKIKKEGNEIETVWRTSNSGRLL